MVIQISDIIVVGILSIVHIVAIIFTWKVGKLFNSKSWRFIFIAFCLFFFRRVITFLDLFEVISSSNNLMISLDTILLPLLGWALIGIGMFRMYLHIKNSMHLEKKLKNATKRKRR
jgi:hypothetical protein